MALLPPTEWRVAEAIAGIGYCNPFLPERVDLERRALGARYIEQGPIIRAQPGERMESLFSNVPAMRERAQLLVNGIGDRLEEIARKIFSRESPDVSPSNT